ncbi:MAG: MotA/TolQ/ExbB proton channel family protein [Burkholderiales bacterium]|nr:MotA/TolQ/ExbB proton channel family protein [Burkholderiales bacterium]MDE1927490.1 MotA/TolQ/ExbB proton channel family protein [Burkholderiales bacterium]MDE2157888.1 MotA/TolQ/ExbB proton channel family protein [Burkholderiales bacterium]MDE2502288.1 MotA/TolQ/ExbB proton channel family protein [Burkholderiales bacterium]
MSTNQILRARHWATHTLASVLAAFAFAGVPMLAHAQAASEPAAASAAAPTAPEPAAAPAPAPVTPAVSEEAVENPYGLQAMWKQGDVVARGTLIVLAIMSMFSWYVIFTKLYEQAKMLRSAKSSAETFWKAGSIKSGVNDLQEGSAFRYIAEEGIRASDHHEGTMVETIDKHTWISMSVDRAVTSINNRLQDGMAVLATVGSTAPFVGLFGTVWGIYNALVKIGLSGQASIDKVAGPVGEALIMTAIGLFVAVPAVMGYNWLIRRNKQVMDQTRAFAGDLHNVLLAGKR